jgi:hypothetical protein
MVSIVGIDSIWGRGTFVANGSGVDGTNNLQASEVANTAIVIRMIANEFLFFIFPPLLLVCGDG